MNATQTPAPNTDGTWWPQVSPETKREHTATWWVYAEPGNTDPAARIRRTAQMRGTWGHDVTCSCGWDSRTGGGLRRYVAEQFDDHRTDAQYAKDFPRR